MSSQNPTRPVSSFIPSPKFFNNLFSPTSTLNNPFETQKNLTQIKPQPDKTDPEGIALALIEPQPDEFASKPNAISRKVLFAANLKIQIPEFSGDYGIKTRSPCLPGRVGSPRSVPGRVGSPRSGLGTGHMSLEEMELTEEYTRVVCHGPNPKTTHIYDNCVVESCCGVIGSGSGSPELKKPGPKLRCDGFLRFCHTCNRNLEDGNDIFVYRLVQIS